MNILAIIPARGGSKGIPRKNLRPLNGKPLIYYIIKTALKSKYNLDVYVSSEDEEILMFAKRFGAKTHKRDMDLAKEDTTLDPVIYEAFNNIQNDNKYDYIITLQPTSPLLKPNTLDRAIEKIINAPEIDVILSAKEKKHLSWKMINGKYTPNYKKRLNRQYLESIFEETGAFVISKASNLINYKKRIVGNIELFILDKEEAIDIDYIDDWVLCEYYLKRKKILFVVTGNEKVGLGHIYRGLLLAHEILDHELIFLVDKSSQLGLNKLREYNFTSMIQKKDDIIDDIKKINPQIVINDILDTKAQYINRLKNLGIKVINFEDIGEGAKSADLVINSLYPEKEVLSNHFYGYKYFCPRDEFLNIHKKEIKKVEDVLISFGGIDINNYTLKTLESIYDYCIQQKIKITIILGIGYKDEKSLQKFSKIKIIKNVFNISEYFLRADIIFTSAGRTVYEIACIGTPTIVMAQNKRELTHFFASSKYGFINLGLGNLVKNEEILKTFINLNNNIEERKYINKLMLSFDLKGSKKRTINLIRNLIEK